MISSQNSPSGTDICIVGGGPAGMTLAYVLARCGIRCELLERHDDFDRDFRGDTIHAGVMEIFDQPGLAERILELPHYKIRSVGLGGGEPLVDLGRLRSRFPYVTMVAQAVFLEFLAGEAKDLPGFSLRMGANVRGLLREENGRVSGVRFRKEAEEYDLRAKLVVACDGRASRMRREAGLEMIPVTDTIDILWFRLSKQGGGAARHSGILTGGRTPFIVLERPEQYQIAAVIAQGGFHDLRAQGIEAFHERLREAAPDLAETAAIELDDWDKVAFLSVTGGRLEEWSLPGLLLIGDAAHTMTPIGGVGINYAIWGAIEAANVLVPAFRSEGGVQPEHLREIQRRREPATRRMQGIQRFVSRHILAPAAGDESVNFGPPRILRWLARLPGIRDLIPRQIAFGGGRRTRLELDGYLGDR